MLPGVGQHTCGTGRVGGFTDRLREGTWVGHVAEHIALQLQREAGTEVGRGKTRGTGEPGLYHVVYSYAEEGVGVAAGKLAVRLVNHLVEADPTLRLRSRARTADPARRATRLRAVDPGPPRRGGAARHPVDPPQ